MVGWTRLDLALLGENGRGFRRLKGEKMVYLNSDLEAGRVSVTIARHVLRTLQHHD
jgi:hypothetical protein